MTKYFYKTVLLRILITFVFCGVGYGLMQLPGMVMHITQTSRLAEKSTQTREEVPSVPLVKKAATSASVGEESGRQSFVAESAQNERVASVLSLKDGEVVKTLRTVIDPELGINIVDLGLIRHIEYVGDKDVTITMIPTSPLCPYLKYLVAEIKKSVPSLTRYKKVRVDIDIQHRWKPEYLSEEGRRNFFGGKL